MSCISSMCLFCVIFLEFEVIPMASYTGNSDGQLYSIRNSLLIINLNNFDPATLLSFHVTGECLLPT